MVNFVQLGLLGAGGVGAYFLGRKLFDGSTMTDAQNIAEGSRKFMAVTSYVLASPGIGLPFDLRNPYTANFLRSEGGQQLIRDVWEGLASNRGERLNNDDRNWISAAATRGDQTSQRILELVGGAYGTRPLGDVGSTGNTISRSALRTSITNYDNAVRRLAGNTAPTAQNYVDALNQISQQDVRNIIGVGRAPLNSLDVDVRNANIIFTNLRNSWPGGATVFDPLVAQIPSLTIQDYNNFFGQQGPFNANNNSFDPFGLNQNGFNQNGTFVNNGYNQNGYQNNYFNQGGYRYNPNFNQYSNQTGQGGGTFAF